MKPWEILHLAHNLAKQYPGVILRQCEMTVSCKGVAEWKVWAVHQKPLYVCTSHMVDGISHFASAKLIRKIKYIGGKI